MEPIYVTRSYLPKRSDFDRYLDRIWDSHWLTNQGQLHQEFAATLADLLGNCGVTLMTNGHLALEHALMALGISGEVITTPFTFASTTHSITLQHIKPVFCDISEKDLTMDADAIEPLITERTTAIMPVHVYGHVCDTDRISSIARKHSLKVIYDAAHAFGVKKDGQSVAQFGDMSMFSFHATKLFHSIEGGLLAYKDEKLKKTLDALKNFGIEDEETINLVGRNAKMNEFQAAMGLCNLSDLYEIIRERREIVMRYRENLAGVNGIRYFEPEANPDIEYNYAYMPILVDEAVFGRSRNQVYDNMKSRGIHTRKYFYPLITDFGCYREEYGDVSLPVARRSAQQVLCLPIYNGLGMETVDLICNLLKN